MYMSQMLCLVTEDFNCNLKVAAVRGELDDALDTLRFVHFASLALLPGPPEAPANASLMFELAIDDGIAPREAVRRLIDAAPSVLWELYESRAPTKLTPEEMVLHLHRKLLPLANSARADGGFVGMRDRSAAQVRAEARWFLTARSKMQRIRDAQQSSGEPSSAELVQRLIVEMGRDPGSAAMQSQPPRSTWLRPRPVALRLVMALVWLVLPIPLLVCLVALIGWLATLVIAQRSFEPTVLAVGGIAAAAVALLLMSLMLLAFALFSRGMLAASVIVAVAAALGILLFYTALVAGYLGFAFPKGAPFGSDALLVLSGMLVLLLVLWLVWRLPRGDAAARWIGPPLSLIGAFVASYLMGAAWNGKAGVPEGLPLSAVAYVGPMLVAVFLIARSDAAKWYFSLGLPLILLLLITEGLAFQKWPQLREMMWTADDLKRHVGLGALALVALSLLLAIVVDLLALLHLRSPWRPLGVPLLVLLALLLASHFAVGVAAHRLLPAELRTPDPWLGLGRWVAHAWIGLSLAFAGLLVLALRWLLESALPALQTQVDKADRGQSTGQFRPYELPASIVDEEAALFNKPSHMISLTDVRGSPGGWNWLMLWLWLHVVGEVGHIVFTKGLLGTASGIKFAHWHLVQNGRRLLFISNYDGDFGGYLDAFINGASQGINLIWRWTQLRQRADGPYGAPAVSDRPYPETTGFAFGGCHHEQAFKAYARASMLPHLYLYQAYDHSNEDIERGTQLRAALAGHRTPVSDDTVLRFLES